MNIEERAAQAAAWKATGQCNCAQAVLKAFEDKLPVDADTLMKLGAGYAAGMGCMESTCGALIGAVMVAGIVTDGKGTPRISKELLQNFQEKCGATICKDLKGIENGAPLCRARSASATLFWHWARCWESKMKKILSVCHGRMCWRGAPPCWKSCDKRERG